MYYIPSTHPLLLLPQSDFSFTTTLRTRSLGDFVCDIKQGVLLTNTTRYYCRHNYHTYHGRTQGKFPQMELKFLYYFNKNKFIKKKYLKHVKSTCSFHIYRIS